MEHYPDPEFGQRLKKARGKRTQADFGKSVGVSQGTVAKWEKGMIPSTNILKKLSAELDVPFTYLVEGKLEIDHVKPKSQNDDIDHPSNCITIEPEAHKALHTRHYDPQIEAVIRMMEDMDEEGKKDIRHGVEKEKLLRELLKQREDKKAG